MSISGSPRFRCPLMQKPMRFTSNVEAHNFAQNYRTYKLVGSKCANCYDFYMYAVGFFGNDGGKVAPRTSKLICGCIFSTVVTKETDGMYVKSIAIGTFEPHQLVCAMILSKVMSLFRLDVNALDLQKIGQTCISMVVGHLGIISLVSPSISSLLFMQVIFV